MNLISNCILANPNKKDENNSHYFTLLKVKVFDTMEFCNQF